MRRRNLSLSEKKLVTLTIGDMNIYYRNLFYIVFLMTILLSSIILLGQGTTKTDLPISSTLKQEEEYHNELKEKSELRNFLITAAENNPGLKAAFNNWKASLERIPQSRSLPDPTITFSYFIREVETRVGPQRGTVGIMQMFPWFGKLKIKGNAATNAADAAKKQYENKKRLLFYNVKKAYYQYYYITRSIDLLERTVTLMKSLEGVIRAKYRVGASPYGTLLRIQVELDRLRDKLASHKESLVPIQVTLNATMNRNLHEPLPAPQQIPTRMPVLSQPQLSQLLHENNRELQALNYLVAMRKNQLNLAKKNRYPDFSIGLNYVVTDSASMSDVKGSSKDPLAALVSVRIPVWQKKNKAAINEAKAGFNAIIHRKQEHENQLQTSLEELIFRYKDSRRKVLLYQNSLLPRARQAFNVTRTAFESGNSDFSDFIDSQRVLLTLQLEYEKARTDLQQYLAQLEFLVGCDLSSDLVGQKYTGDIK